MLLYILIDIVVKKSAHKGIVESCTAQKMTGFEKHLQGKVSKR